MADSDKRFIQQLVVIPGVGWNGMTGEESFVDDEEKIYCVDTNGRGWKLVGPNNPNARWVRLPDLPDFEAFNPKEESRG